MTNAFIFHGIWGNPKDNWFPYLTQRLKSHGISVAVPQFPTPEGHNLTNWLSVLEEYKKHITHETLMIGHSMACAFILDVLEIMNLRIRAAFLVAGWTGKLGGDPEIDRLNATFDERVFNWDKIRDNCKVFYLFNSDNDPYVPIKKGVELSQNLKTSVIQVSGAGHFNTKAGYTTFPLLWKTIKKELVI